MTHVVVDVLSKLLDSKTTGSPDQIVDTSLFFVEHVWIQEVKSYLEIGQMPKTLNLAQKHKLVKKTKPFILKEGIMYKSQPQPWACDQGKSL